MTLRHIYFEGPNFSGKSTIKEEFAKITNEEYICVDREAISNLIYDLLLRKIPQHTFYEYIDTISHNCFRGDYYIIILPSIDVLKKRNTEDSVSFIEREYFMYEMIAYMLNHSIDNVLVFDSPLYNDETPKEFAASIKTVLRDCIEYDKN